MSDSFDLVRFSDVRPTSLRPSNGVPLTPVDAQFFCCCASLVRAGPIRFKYISPWGALHPSAYSIAAAAGGFGGAVRPVFPTCRPMRPGEPASRPSVAASYKKSCHRVLPVQFFHDWAPDQRRTRSAFSGHVVRCDGPRPGRPADHVKINRANGLAGLALRFAGNARPDMCVGQMASTRRTLARARALSRPGNRRFGMRRWLAISVTRRGDCGGVSFDRLHHLLAGRSRSVRPRVCSLSGLEPASAVPILYCTVSRIFVPTSSNRDDETLPMLLRRRTVSAWVPKQWKRLGGGWRARPGTLGGPEPHTATNCASEGDTGPRRLVAIGSVSCFLSDRSTMFVRRMFMRTGDRPIWFRGPSARAAVARRADFFQCEIPPVLTTVIAGSRNRCVTDTENG